MSRVKSTVESLDRSSENAHSASHAPTLTLSRHAVAAIASHAAEQVIERLANLDTPGEQSWPEWMNAETAARYLDISEERIRKLKDRRKIPHYQEGPGHRIFFRRSELDEWMAAFRRPSR
jgi:excisionase family DNA binding protein